MRPRLGHCLLLAGLAGLGLLAACPGGSPEAARGAAVYVEHRCGMCHADDRSGKPLAPPLKGLAAHWTADELVREYFPDPVSYQNNDPRLREMLQTYNTMKMPPVQGSPEDLRALAEWLVKD
jgi:mono/diheme cytochrome c family protein